VFPVLPISRANAQGKPDRGERARTHFTMNSQTKDDTKCDYWRYCGVDGNLCACCGGGPPHLSRGRDRLDHLLGRDLPSTPMTTRPI